MIKLLALCYLPLIIFGCVTPEERALKVKTLALEAGNPINCEDIVACDQEEKSPSFCRAFHFKGMSQSWASNDCLAKNKIYREVCRLGIQPRNIADLTCAPDPSGGECPFVSKACTYDFKPSRCRATSYNNKDVPWEHQLIGNGSNICTAQQELMIRACSEGLRPSLLGKIKCEVDFTAGECPPSFSCNPQKEKSAECSVNSMGDVKFKTPWVERGKSTCFASYALRVKACRFADEKNKLKPSMLGNIQCKENP